MKNFSLFLEGLRDPEVGTTLMWSKGEHRFEASSSFYWFRIGFRLYFLQ